MMLNIACGRRYNDKWVNIDFHADSSDVRKVNILSGLPFDDALFEVVYCSHFLEHLSLASAALTIGNPSSLAVFAKLGYNSVHSSFSP